MKMTLRNRIAQAQELLARNDYANFAYCMHSNDKDVVYYASRMLGSNLSPRYNSILMGRNALPLWWYDNSKLRDCKINFGLKSGYIQVVDYLEWGYSITPGRVMKLMAVLNKKSRGLFKVMEDHADKENLHNYLRNLNNLRMVCNEMTEIEIYDFSFDMVYELIDELSLSTETLALAFLIMYWIQRENDLIPLAMTCARETFISQLDIYSEDTRDERVKKKEFRLFMRKLLDLHLKLFIKKESKGCKEKLQSRDRILQLIKDNPSNTAKTMASCLGLSVQAVQKQIAILKKENRLKRVGPDNGGKWKIVKPRDLSS